MLCDSKVNFITKKQRITLWNELDDENRSNVWSKLKQKQKSTLLELLPRLDQQKLWM